MEGRFLEIGGETWNFDFWEELERGEARYVILYKDGTPDEIMFVGYSFD